jgi:WhiB family redox-sensing transcriptional regulator
MRLIATDPELLRPVVERRFRHDPEGMTWIAGAACVDEDPELFFPVGTGPAATDQERRAKRVCAGCPVRAECLEWSLVTCQDAGVWGGLGEEERREIRRARRRANGGHLVAVV